MTCHFEGNYDKITAEIEITSETNNRKIISVKEIIISVYNKQEIIPETYIFSLKQTNKKEISFWPGEDITIKIEARDFESDGFSSGTILYETEIGPRNYYSGEDVILKISMDEISRLEAEVYSKELNQLENRGEKEYPFRTLLANNTSIDNPFTVSGFGTPGARVEAEISGANLDELGFSLNMINQDGSFKIVIFYDDQPQNTLLHLSLKQIDPKGKIESQDFSLYQK